MSNSNREKEELISILAELYQSHLLTSTGGNISIRDSQNAERIWIMPSGVHKGQLRADQLVLIDIEGDRTGDSAFSPSSEKFVHCEIYRARPDIHAVIHAHARASSVLCMTGTEFAPISTGAALVGEIPTVPFVVPGTIELGRAVSKALGQSGVGVFMQNHGLVVVASSLRRAADLTFVIERTAEEILGCLALGKVPPVLPPETIEVIKAWRHHHL